MSVINAL